MNRVMMEMIVEETIKEFFARLDLNELTREMIRNVDGLLREEYAKAIRESLGNIVDAKPESREAI